MHPQRALVLATTEALTGPLSISPELPYRVAYSLISSISL
jgi:hypothetical protein